MKGMDRSLMETTAHIPYCGVGIFVLNNEALMGRLQVKGLFKITFWSNC